jgi:hypothetical protein
VLLGLLSWLYAVESYTTIKEAIIKNLDECCKAKKEKNDFPQMIPQYYPIHKKRWLGGYNKVQRENKSQSPICL